MWNEELRHGERKKKMEPNLYKLEKVRKFRNAEFKTMSI
jgi:hypothetical protein